jgi:hypothetical protein
MAQIRLKNSTGTTSKIGQQVKLIVGSKTAFVNAEFYDTGIIGTCAQAVPNGNTCLVNLIGGSTSSTVIVDSISAINPATAELQSALLQEITEENDINKATEENLGVEDLLFMAMDRSQNTPLQVQLPNDLKQEPDGGLYIADMKGPFFWKSSTASQPFILDCTGYQSITVHKITTGIVTPYIANDGANWIGTIALQPTTAIASTTILTAAGVYTLPVVSKWLKLVGPASAVQCFIYLSQAPCVIGSSLNIAGTNAITGGIAGSIAVGGNVASGVAPTSNPIQMAGVDSLPIPLTRRTLTDQLGRLQIGNIPSQRTIGVNRIGYDPAYMNPLEVQDTTRADDGQSLLDLMVQVLKEIQITNQILTEQGRNLQTGQISSEEPNDYRNENKLLN